LKTDAQLVDKLLSRVKLRKKTDKTKCFVSFLIEARRKRINGSSRRENMNYHEFFTN